MKLKKNSNTEIKRGMIRAGVRADMRGGGIVTDGTLDGGMFELCRRRAARKECKSWTCRTKA